MELQSYINGYISGMVGIILSHPFDTIKTNIQSNKKVLLGFKSLYRGVLPPLLGVGLEKSIVFGTYNNVSNSYNTVISGAISGLVASIIVTPIERFKILRQNNIACNVIRMRDLYRGFSATLTREIPGFSIYFTAYNYLYDGDIRKSFLYGAISGAIAWTFIYPQDLVKTNMQSNSHIHCSVYMYKIYKSGGILGFYKGFHLALLRAMPLHGGAFFTMELLSC